jgi:serine O-acetyltransferase
MSADRMTYADYKARLASDLYRLGGARGFRAGVKAVRNVPGFDFVFWMRTCRYTRRHPLLKFLAYPLARWRYGQRMFRYGISIPFDTDIGAGFYIGHFGGIVVNAQSRIGRNCNISQGVTLGQSNRGARQGCPTIGDNVYLGPGAKVIGAVHIDDHAAIGANAVVTRDVPAHAVVAGIPARVISFAGSEGYGEFTTPPPSPHPFAL